ncbi:MAG: hypothetical protein AB2L14_21040 [Candidatus Xenobiia bacterium LiM19]
MKFHIMKIALSVSLFFFIIAGCTGCAPKTTPSPSPSPRPTQNVYENKEMGYKVVIPEGWNKPESVDVGELYLEFAKADFTPKPSFNIVSSRVDVYDVRDPKNQAEIKDEVEKDLKCAEERVITLAGKPAYQIEYGIEKGDTSLMVKQTYFFNKDILIVCTAGCKEDKYPDWEEDFDRIQNSITLTEPLK